MMKAKIATAACVALCMSCYSQQTNGNGNKPKGMQLVRTGSFDMKITENRTKSDVTMTVPTFWMSDEITNREYREFMDHVLAYPNEIMSVPETKIIAVGDSANGTLRDSVYFKRSFVKNSVIAANLVDSTMIEKKNKGYNNYLTDPRYNEYPVVGVSYQNAVYYCLWKTKMENDKRRLEGKEPVPEYRLPTEDEWSFVASQSLLGTSPGIQKDSVNPSKRGVMNICGLYNLANNVTEWTSSIPRITGGKPNTSRAQTSQRIARGGSWKTKPDINLRYEINKDTRDDHTGFRVVRSICPSDGIQ